MKDVVKRVPLGKTPKKRKFKTGRIGKPKLKDSHLEELSVRKKMG